MVGGKDSGVILRERDDGVVSPVAVVVAEDFAHLDSRVVDADFFSRFAQCRSDDVFVRISRATRQGPGAAAMCPAGAQLQEHARPSEIGSHEQQPCGTMHAPVRVAALAANESVAVAMCHGSAMRHWSGGCGSRSQLPAGCPAIASEQSCADDECRHHRCGNRKRGGATEHFVRDSGE